MKNKLMMAAASIALLGTLGHFGAKPLLAQIRAALVKSIDERGRSPYMVQATCAQSGNQCNIALGNVPANKRFVAEYINATIIGQHALGLYASLVVPSLESPISLTSHFEITSANALDYYSVSMPVVLYFEPGQALAFSLQSIDPSKPIFGTFTLSGYLIDLTQ